MIPKMPKMPKVPTISSLRTVKRTIKAAPRKKIPGMKSLAPVKPTPPAIEKAEKLVHLEHVEDEIINSGREGLLYSMALLKELHKRLVDREAKIEISEKYDGSPSIVFGIDPLTKRFFVATKAFFSKVPKINFSEEDIENNHGYSADLVYKLTTAFRYLPEVIPASGVFQGDLMYVADMVKEDASFTANTVKYTCRTPRVEVKVRRSALGIAVHTEYVGNDLRRLTRTRLQDTVFRESSDVYFIPVQVPLQEVNYPAPVQEEVLSLLNTVHLATSPATFTESHYAVIHKYKAVLKAYINKMVKAGTSPHVLQFASSLKESVIDKEINVFKDLFYVHSKLQRIKDILNETLYATNVHRPFDTSINDVKTKGEGFVISFNGRMMKIVDRQEFSRHNFLRARGLPENAKVTIFAFARMNPPHMGHSVLIKAIKDRAEALGADHLIALSASCDKNNPLSPSKKLMYLKEFYPDTNFKLCNSHFVNELRKLHETGTQHLIMMAGEDRIENYEALLNELNGKDEFFCFSVFQVLSAGNRNSNGLGVESMSGTKMREFARVSDFASFEHCAPFGNTALIRHLYEDVQQGLGQ